MQTTVNIDFGVVIAALAPTIAIVVTAILAGIARRAANRERERIAAEVAKELKSVHTLVNDQLTREKVSRLDVMKSQQILMERLIGTANGKERALIEDLGKRIAELEAEIRARDVTAGAVASAAPAKGDA